MEKLVRSAVTVGGAPPQRNENQLREFILHTVLSSSPHQVFVILRYRLQWILVEARSLNRSYLDDRDLETAVIHASKTESKV